MSEYTREQRNLWARAYYKKNREKIRAMKRTPKLRAYGAAWVREARRNKPEHYRASNRNRVRLIRASWVAANGPCKKCGSSKSLEVDHINPKTKDPKIKPHHGDRIWCWSEARRAKELKKCQVLCFICHRVKTNEERGWKLHGEIRYQLGCRCKECIMVHKRKLRKQKRDKLKHGKKHSSTISKKCSSTNSGR